MSTALYRRYRPETFTDVIGQEHVTEPLMAALAADRITHAYLFSGPRGCGKTTSARILARCLNCAQGPTAQPCGQCDSCVDLARGGPGSLDVVEIDAASHNGVDDARELRERAAFAPARDRYKIFILDEAHMVTTQGFNALLKLVEEPPPHIKFVFATTEPDKVIGTIRSRTHHYPFRLVAPEKLTNYLQSLAGAEGIDVAGGVLPLVVRAGGGSVRDSLSVLDQLIAGTTDANLTYEHAVALLGFTHGALLDDAVDALAARDGLSLFRVVDRVIESGHAPRRFVEDLLERLRDLIVVRAAGDEAASVLRSVPADQLERMRIQAQHLGAASLSRAADLVNEALTEMTGATSPRLHLELLCARLLLPAVDDGVDGFAARLDRLEAALAGAPAPTGPVPAPSPAPATPATPAPATPAHRPTQIADGDAGPGATPPAAAATSTDAAPTAPETAAARPTVAPMPAVAASGVPAGVDAVDASAEASQTPDSEPSAAETQPGADAAAPGSPDAAAQPGHSDTAGQPARAQQTDARSGAPQQDVSPPPAATQQPATGGDSGAAMTTDQVRRRWPEVLQTLAQLKRTSWALVSQDAQVVDLSATTLSLGFSTEGLATAFRSGPHATFVAQALRETLGVDVQIHPVLGGSGAPVGGPAGGPAAPAPPPAQSTPPAPTAAPAQDAPSVPAGPPAQDAPSAQPAPSAQDAPSAQGGAPAQGISPAPDPEAERSAGAESPSGGDMREGDSPAVPTAGGDGWADIPVRRPPQEPAAQQDQPAEQDQPVQQPAQQDPPAPANTVAPPPPDDGGSAAWDVADTAPPETGASHPPATPAGGSADGGTPPGAGEPTGETLIAPPRRDPNAAPPVSRLGDEIDDPSPDDPDLEHTEVVGAPLVARLLGGTVIDEEIDDPGEPR